MENEGEEDGREREARNEKAFTLCEKRRAEGKVGRKEKESGGGVKRVGDEERKGSRSGDEGGAGREE